MAPRPSPQLARKALAALGAGPRPGDEASPRAPRWAPQATAALAEAGARVRVIAANTPVNLRRELSRLTRAWRTSGAAAPRFTYEEPPDHGRLRGVLDAIAEELE